MQKSLATLKSLLLLVVSFAIGAHIPEREIFGTLSEIHINAPVITQIE